MDYVAQAIYLAGVPYTTSLLGNSTNVRNALEVYKYAIPILMVLKHWNDEFYNFNLLDAIDQNEKMVDKKLFRCLNDFFEEIYSCEVKDLIMLLINHAFPDVLRYDPNFFNSNAEEIWGFIKEYKTTRIPPIIHEYILDEYHEYEDILEHVEFSSVVSHITTYYPSVDMISDDYYLISDLILTSIDGLYNSNIKLYSEVCKMILLGTDYYDRYIDFLSRLDELGKYKYDYPKLAEKVFNIIVSFEGTYYSNICDYDIRELNYLSARDIKKLMKFSLAKSIAPSLKKPSCFSDVYRVLVNNGLISYTIANDVVRILSDTEVKDKYLKYAKLLFFK